MYYKVLLVRTISIVRTLSSFVVFRPLMRFARRPKDGPHSIMTWHSHVSRSQSLSYRAPPKVYSVYREAARRARLRGGGIVYNANGPPIVDSSLFRFTIEYTPRPSTLMSTLVKYTGGARPAAAPGARAARQNATRSAVRGANTRTRPNLLADGDGDD